MATRKSKGTADVIIAEPTPTEIPAKLFVITATLSVGTVDEGLAGTAFCGLKYLLAREFMRQQPGLALFYDLEFSILHVRHGSWHFDFKVVAKLKRHIKNVYKKASAVEIAGVILGTPAAIVSGYELYEKLIPPVQQCMRSDLPQVQINIINIEFRPPDEREKLPRGQGKFTL
jgi:hypothetical protein